MSLCVIFFSNQHFKLFCCFLFVKDILDLNHNKKDDCRMETDKIADVVTVCVLGKNNILSEIIDRRL